MKTNLILLLISYFTFNLSAQDTLIERFEFSLEISRADTFTRPFQSITTNKDFQVTEFAWTNHSIKDIVEKWTEFMELEEIDYRIEGKIIEDIDYFSFIDTAAFRQAMDNGDTNVVLSDFITISDSSFLLLGYNVTLFNHQRGDKENKVVMREAFEVFAEFLQLDVKVEKEEKTFWMLHIIDLPNATISEDQNKFWKRTNYETYTYYETIKFRRIADLLSRKLDSFVRPIPYNTYKFNVKIPTSDNPEDLQYAMNEHGLELIQVTEFVEVLVISD